MLFAYGSLINDEILMSLLGRRLTKTTVTLINYKRVKVAGEEYPAIRPNQGSIVEGILISGLSSDDIRCLDHYEGDCYERIPVTVVTADNKQQHCETYIFKPEYYDMLSNEDWCNEEFRNHHMQQFLSRL